MTRKLLILVDDDVQILKLVGSLLEKGPFTVFKAKHSDQALLMCDNLPGTVDLLVTDLRMDPFINGHALAERLRHKYPRMQVLFISGTSLEEWSRARLEVRQGRADFLKKPFSPKEFLLKVEQMLQVPAVAT